MADLNQLKVAIVAVDGFEEKELTEPLKALRDAGASVEILSIKTGKIQGFHHHDKTIQVPVDHSLNEVKPSQYEALVLPGGALNADQARIQPQILAFVREFDAEGKPIAAICHAPWILISSGIVQGRKLTSYHTIQDDLKNAGAEWLNEKVVVDKNLVTSRQPSDLPAFNREMIKLFSQKRAAEEAPAA